MLLLLLWGACMASGAALMTDGELTTQEGSVKPEVIALRSKLSFTSAFMSISQKSSQVAFSSTELGSSKSPVQMWVCYRSSPLRLTCCVIITSSSIDAAACLSSSCLRSCGQTTYERNWPSGKFWSYFKPWSQYLNTSRFSLASHH